MLDLLNDTSTYGPITPNTALICSSSSGDNDSWRIGPFLAV
jgi:hypothetical protein